jgi:hypothetical protein
MSNYYYNGTDLETLCEPQGSATRAADGTGFVGAPFFSGFPDLASYSASYDYMGLGFPSGLYNWFYSVTSDWIPIEACSKGFRPLNTIRFSLPAGSWRVLRNPNTSALEVYTSSGTLSASYPACFGMKVMMFALTGGGGGSGGGSSGRGGGGGGGGACAIGHVIIDETTNYLEGIQVVIGSGGSAGGNNGSGGTGGASSITRGFQSVTCGAGQGGYAAGVSGNGAYGGGGYGGSVTTNGTWDNNFRIYGSRSGGNGGTAAASGGYGASGGGCSILSPKINPENLNLTFNASSGGSAPGTGGGGGASDGNGGTGGSGGSNGNSGGNYGSGAGGGSAKLFSSTSGAAGRTGYCNFAY